MGKETKESGQRSAASDGRDSLDAHISDLQGVAEMSERSPLAWRLGVDRDVLHGPTRRTELRNWLRHALNGDKLL